MDVHHRRGGSNSNNGSHFRWDPTAKPPMKRSASSHASHASDSEREGPSTRTGTIGKRTGRSSTPLDIAAASISAANLPSAHFSATPSGSGQQRASTPTLSHQSPALTSMNPPQRTPSRRSSFSGSQVEALSPPTSATSLAPYSHSNSINATGGSTPIKTATLTEAGQAVLPTGSTSRSASRNRGFTPRSPSPAPPLPAIRAPPSPKQRMASAVYQQTQTSMMGVGTLAKAGMRLYGDENFSGFFRRLTFSPDGALLVTPTGIFENSSQAALHQMQSPASPTVAAHAYASRRLSEQEDPRASPASPILSNHPSAHSPAGPSAAAPPPPAAAAPPPPAAAAPPPPAAAAPPPPAAAAPSAHSANVPKSTVYLYGRGNLHKSNAPIAHLPGHKTASLVIKFSPVLFELRKGAGWNKGADDMDGIAPHPNVPLEVGKQKTVSLGFSAGSMGVSSAAVQDDHVAMEMDRQPKTTRSYSSTSSNNSSPTKQTPPIVPSTASSPTAMIGLPYRMIFAVATHDSVWIYDTQQGGPLCCFSNMHYASFTDLTWSSDGQTLMMCSTDGYCSVVVFDYGELGVPYTYQSQPSLQAAAANNTTTTTSTAPLSALPMTKAATVADPTLMARRESGQGISSQGQDGVASHGLGLATGTEEGQQSVESAENLNPGLKKKRRIAPTLQGPIGS
jgi:chromatin assembly factor 1 subunit B